MQDYSSPDMLFSLEGRSLKLNNHQDVKDILADLDKAGDISSVCFSGNTIGVEAAQLLAAKLKEKRNLKIVNLSDIFTGRLKEEIPPALTAFVDALIDKELDHVNFSDNAFGPAGAGPLCRLLAENWSIKSLKLENNGLGIEGAKLISSALREGVQKSKESGKVLNVQSIVMGRNRLQSDGAKILSEAFAVLPGLKEVRLHENSIRQDGVEVLLKALKQIQTLEVLDLQDNTFTLTGSTILAESLPGWPSLKSLNVGDCLLGSEGCKLVLKTLMSNCQKLTKLILIFNEMDSEGLSLVLDLLKDRDLDTLHLNGNCFDPDSDVVNSLKRLLESRGRGDALDELDEMEFEEEDEDDDEEEEKEENEETAADDDKDVDELASKIAELKSS
ncbi:hypothetical protein HDU96_004970 [Phlyctochytrium bullatum]|nr:hypothetical protein HDU96_004970 [Phlyctochytrium bullatum]